MGEQLRDDLEALSVLFAQAADWYRGTGLRITPTIIEKDFWVTEALRVLAGGTTHSAPNNHAYPVTARAVFKGGTSLSKAHSLIERFSEDIDVYLDIQPQPGTLPASAVRAGTSLKQAPPFTLGNSRVDSIMKDVSARVADALGANAETWGTSRTGTKRGYRLLYPRPADAEPLNDQVKEGILLELVRMGTPDPNSPHTLSSMLSHWAAMTATLALGDFDELTPFTIDVLAPERTLVDKLCILHDLGTTMSEDKNKEPGYHARHYYDVHQLLNNDGVIQAITDRPGLVPTYAATAAAESTAARRPPATTRPDDGFASSPAFTTKVIAQAQPGYTLEMTRLGYGKFPDLQTVAALVHRHGALL